MKTTDDSTYMGFCEVGYIHPVEGGLLGYLVRPLRHEAVQILGGRTKIAR